MFMKFNVNGLDRVTIFMKENDLEFSFIESDTETYLLNNTDKTDRDSIEKLVYDLLNENKYL